VEPEIKTDRQVFPAKKINRINRNLLVFTFFLALSFIFWYLNSLSREIDITLRIPVTYTVPDNMSQSGSLPSRISISLRGYGFSILREKIRIEGNPLKINLSELIIEHSGKGSEFFIPASALVQDLNRQLGKEIRILSVKPDTLLFTSR
jgi:hypothetical protein